MRVQLVTAGGCSCTRKTGYSVLSATAQYQSKDPMKGVPPGTDGRRQPSLRPQLRHLTRRAQREHRHTKALAYWGDPQGDPERVRVRCAGSGQLSRCGIHQLHQQTEVDIIDSLEAD
jgi:hypothetical protein